MAGGWQGAAARILRRTLLSGAGAAVVLAVGTSALFVTRAPAWVSLTVEPLSLMLMPGVVLSMIFTRAHDYTSKEVLEGAYVCYVIAFYLLLWGRDGVARRRMRASGKQCA